MAAGTPGALLMQRAGDAVAQEIQRAGIRGRSLSCADPATTAATALSSPSAWRNPDGGASCVVRHRRCLARGCTTSLTALDGAIEPLTPRVIDHAELVVDSLFGSGLSRRLDPQVSDTLSFAARRGLPIIAVDIPSGIMGDSGEDLGLCRGLHRDVRGKETGHLLLPGEILRRDRRGDIGVPQSVLDSLPSIPGKTPGAVA